MKPPCFLMIWSLAAFLALPGLRVQAEQFEPIGLYLTWQRDPTSTMTIDWHTEEVADSQLEYRRKGEESWESENGENFPFPFSSRTVHRVELTGLEADSEYLFRFGPESAVYSFRTMPREGTRPIRFVAGGDVRHRKDWMEEGNRMAAHFDPDFIIWGGDLAYADGREDRLDNWIEWFDALKSTLVAGDGRVIPVVVAIGNHEVRGGYYFRNEEYQQDAETREQMAPYFYRLFAMPGQPGYNALDFGDYLSILLLDTNHTNPISGEQTEWLAETLAERKDVPHIFPLYHVTAYPSHRSFEDRTSRDIREHWAPLFEKFNVRVAFENHDHTYKRTIPIREGKPHPQGIVYIGDGCWGVAPRKIHDPAETWYLETAHSARHVIVVTLHRTHQHFLVVNTDGEIIDEFPASAQRAAWNGMGISAELSPK